MPSDGRSRSSIIGWLLPLMLFSIGLAFSLPIFLALNAPIGIEASTTNQKSITPLDPHLHADVQSQSEKPGSVSQTEISSRFNDLSLEAIHSVESKFQRQALMYIFLENVDATTIGAVIEENYLFEPYPDDQSLFTLIVAKYADIDPKSAIEFLEESGPYSLTTFGAVVMHIWARRDLDGAVHYLSTIPSPLRESFTRVVLWARDDLEMQQRRDIARQLGVALGLMDRINTSHIRRDPNLDHAWVLDQLADQGIKENIAYAKRIVWDWADSNKDAALAHIVRMNVTTEARTSLTLEVVRKLYQTNPETALQLAIGASGVNTESLLDYVFRHWVDSNQETALEMTAAIPNVNLRRKMRDLVLREILRHDPEYVIDYFSTHGIEGSSIRLAAVRAIGKKDPQRALNLIVTNSGDSSVLSTAKRVFDDWSLKDLDESLIWFESLDDDLLKRHLAGYLVGPLVERDPRDALNWALTLDRQFPNNHLPSQVMHDVVRVDPDLAFTMFKDAASELRESNSSVLNAIGTEFMRRGRASDSVNLIGEFEDEIERLDFVHRSFRDAMTYDESVANAVQSLQGQFRDEAIAGLFAGGLIPHREHQKFLDLIQDSVLRQRIQERLDSL